MNENPYESPKSILGSDTSASPFGEVVYYRTNTRRLSYAEFWRLSQNPFEFLIAASFKTLGICLPSTFAFASALALRPIDPRQWPPSALEQLRPLADQATECGLRFAWAYVLPSLGAIESCALAYVSDDGATIVPLIYVRAWNAQGSREQVAFSMLSRLADGRVIATSGTKRQLNAPPEFAVEHLTGQSVRDVLERHRARLSEHEAALVHARDPAEVFEAVQHYEHRSTEFQQSRGVYVVATPKEMEAYSRLSQQQHPAGPPKSTAFQGLEFLCWIVLGICLFLVPRVVAPQPGRLFALALLGVAIAIGGLSLIWICRARRNRRSRRAATD